jgi:hypothetical protein
MGQENREPLKSLNVDGTITLKQIVYLYYADTVD